MEQFRAWLNSFDWPAIRSAILSRLHPAAAADAAQAAAANTLAAFMSPPPTPAAAATSLPTPKGLFESRFPPDKYHFPTLPPAVASALDRVGPLWSEYSQRKYRKWQLVIIFLMYVAFAVGLGKWMEGNYNDEDPVEVAKPIQGEPGWVDPKLKEASKKQEESPEKVELPRPRVDVFHDRPNSPMGGSSVGAEAEIQRVATSLLPDSGAEIRVHGPALEEKSFRGTPHLFMRDLLSVEPPISSSQHEGPYAVLLLSTDHDLAYVVQTLKRRRYAPPVCVGVVLDALPGMGDEEDSEEEGPAMMLWDVADRVFVWQGDTARIREIVRGAEEPNGGPIQGDDNSEDDETSRSEYSQSNDAAEPAVEGLASEAPPASPSPTLSHDPSPAAEMGPSSAGPPLETQSPVRDLPERPHTPRRARHHPELVDGVYPHAAAVANTSLAYHDSRPQSRQGSRPTTPSPTLIRRPLAPPDVITTPASPPSNSGGRRAGAPSKIAVSGPAGTGAARRERSPSTSFGGAALTATTTTGLLSPHAHIRASLSPGSSSHHYAHADGAYFSFSSLPVSGPGSPGRLGSPGRQGAYSTASTPTGGGAFGRSRARTKARDRVASLGMLSPGFERMAESADARRSAQSAAEDRKAEELWRRGGYPFPVAATSLADREDEDAVE